MQNVKYTIQGNVRSKRNLMIEALFTRYQEGQKAIFNNYLEERNVTVSLPVRFNKMQLFTRLNIYQIILP
ncbi:MAG: hypothetical protein RI983_1381 [Bacteroidota bacterium]